MHPFLSYAAGHQKDIVALLRAMVECESPSNEPKAVNRFVDLLIERTRDIGVAKVFRTARFGKHVRIEFKLPGKVAGKRKDGQLLALGHSDTVWPLGTLRQMPFRQEGGRLWGPGVLDMKAGLAFFLSAVRALRELDVPVERRVALLVVSDEETGSESSRAITEAEARKSAAVLVLEPGTGLAGKLKTSRKGVGAFNLRVEGRAAHAGVDFANGASAIVELARQIEKIVGFTDVGRGITVNPGIIFGGTRTNVVAAEAEAAVDIRVVRERDGARLTKQFQKLRPFDRRCRLTVTGGLNRPPMERTKAIAALFSQAKELALELGVNLEESSTGGGSDGNFTAALGTPTLDGLGGVGEGAHAMNESILVDRIADRTALLARLLQTL
jgi:glutamate carboxypeptidase